MGGRPINRQLSCIKVRDNAGGHRGDTEGNRTFEDAGVRQTRSKLTTAGVLVERKRSRNVWGGVASGAVWVWLSAGIVNRVPSE